MHEAVRRVWHSFSEPLEGRILHMYLDVKGYVTCGVGNLIDPVSEALKLPWKRQATGELATPSEVRSAWTALKGRPEYASKSAHHALDITRLVLSDVDVDILVQRRLAENEQYLVAHTFADFPNFPADAQLAILSMAWACGAGFTDTFKQLTQAVLGEDWLAAKATCTIREAGNPGVVPRNRANRLCFDNAAAVMGRGMARGVLHWPRSAAQAEAPTPLPSPTADAELRAIATEAAADAHADNLIATQRRAMMDTIDDEPESDVDPEGEHQS